MTSSHPIAVEIGMWALSLALQDGFAKHPGKEMTTWRRHSPVDATICCGLCADAVERPLLPGPRGDADRVHTGNAASLTQAHRLNFRAAESANTLRQC